MKFYVVIGNPPYDNRLWYRFLKKVPEFLTPKTGRFSILMPSSVVGSALSLPIFRDRLKLTEVDYTAGVHFQDSISGTWVAKFSGIVGQTTTFDLKLPGGDILNDRSLDNFNSASANFMTEKKRELSDMFTVDDISIAEKVLDGSAELISHKDDIINTPHYAYICSMLKRQAKIHSDPFPGILSLWCNTDRVIDRGDSKGKLMTNGKYLVASSAEDAENMCHIYNDSKLFSFLAYLAGSGSNHAGSYINTLPNVSGVRYNTEQDLYDHFGLTTQEVSRIDTIL